MVWIWSQNAEEVAYNGGFGDKADCGFPSGVKNTFGELAGKIRAEKWEPETANSRRGVVVAKFNAHIGLVNFNGDKFALFECGNDFAKTGARIRFVAEPEPETTKIKVDKVIKVGFTAEIGDKGDENAEKGVIFAKDEEHDVAFAEFRRKGENCYCFTELKPSMEIGAEFRFRLEPLRHEFEMMIEKTYNIEFFAKNVKVI